MDKHASLRYHLYFEKVCHKDKNINIVSINESLLCDHKEITVSKTRANNKKAL